MKGRPPAGSTAARTDGGCDDTPSGEEVLLASRAVGENLCRTDLSVPGIHCGGCIRTIERALGRLDGVEQARVNLTARRVTVRWRAEGGPPPFIEALIALGYRPHLDEPGAEETNSTLSELVRALAVAGFATGNIMLLSVSVWSGAEPEYRNLFHWISAAIALPVLAYSGRIFFRSAWGALRHGRTNMDVPISIGVTLAFGMSLFDTIHHQQHVYFDAAVMLLFFLLIGRTLDCLMRERARSAVAGLARLAARGAMVERADGTRAYLPVEEIEPGMTVLLAAGERVPVDGRVTAGMSDLDCSLVTGESEPRSVGQGARLQAGTLNMTGPLRIEVIAAARDSFLAEMIRLMEAAEAGRSAYRRIADRASRLYAPLVHVAAFASFLGWMMAAGDLHQAVTIAIAVLIITCPCALGLAVPMVQMVAARRLFEHGVMVRDGAAMERLGEIDTVVFDKTGTLTLGRPVLCESAGADEDGLALAAALAAYSRHPHSRALVDAHGARDPESISFDRISECPGYGVEAISGADTFRLGRADWALDDGATQAVPSERSHTVLSRNGELVKLFAFDDPVRPGAWEAVAELKKRGLAVEILSGDHDAPVEALARKLGIAHRHAGVLPHDKAARLGALASAGRKVLMVGDGLNDGPALVAAHVSMAPASAADVGRNAADFVFLRDSLTAVPLALAVSRRAGGLVRQNLALAILYNAIALPFAVLGYVTPLFAAVAMSSSSILVVANAMRLNAGMRPERRRLAETRTDDGRMLSATGEAR